MDTLRAKRSRPGNSKADRKQGIGWAGGLAMIAAFSLIASICGCKPSSPAVPPPASATAQQSDSPNAVGAGTASGRRSRRGRAETQAAPGDFDFYLLNLSWSPEFCATHAGSSECGRGLGFVVHGLWPQNFNGNYPERCSDAPGPSNPQAYTDLIPTVSLVEHEWQTHGTCSGLAADAYFAAVRAAYSRVKIPAEIGSASGPASVTPQQFLARFAQVNPGFPSGSLALSCGNNRLTAIELCLTKDLQPESCQGVRSCRANAIQIAPREPGR